MAVKQVFTSNEQAGVISALECFHNIGGEVTIKVMDDEDEANIASSISLDSDTLVALIIRLSQLQSEIDEMDNESKVANGK